MSYRLRYTRTAAKDIKKLDVVMRKRLKNRLELFVQNPKKYGVRLTDAKIGGYRFRIGDLRVIFDLEGKWVTVLRVGFRGDVYR